jgi:hypothetical protein
MGSNPANLALRFILELAVLFALGYWGWTQHAGIWRFVWSIGLVGLAAIVWGTFAVPDDPSRSGNAPVPVPGFLRLIIEMVIFAAGVWAFYAAGLPLIALVFGILTLIHYAISYDRLIWLLKN